MFSTSITFILSFFATLSLTSTSSLEYLLSSNFKRLKLKKLKIKVTDVENMENRFLNEDKSLNARVSEDYNQEFGNFIVDENTPNESDIVNKLDLIRKRSWFKEAMRDLGIRESQIIALRHLSDDPLTLEKLGELFKISKERVRQIENRAIKKLKSLVRKLSSRDMRLIDTKLEKQN